MPDVEERLDREGRRDGRSSRGQVTGVAVTRETGAIGGRPLHERDAGGNLREAAEHLGMTYDQFRHHYKKYGLGDPGR